MILFLNKKGLLPNLLKKFVLIICLTLFIKCENVWPAQSFCYTLYTSQQLNHFMQGYGSFNITYYMRHFYKNSFEIQQQFLCGHCLVYPIVAELRVLDLVFTDSSLSFANDLCVQYATTSPILNEMYTTSVCSFQFR